MCTLSVGGFCLFLPTKTSDVLPAPPPLNRRAAERGSILTIASQDDSLIYEAPPNIQTHLAYVPSSESGSDKLTQIRTRTGAIVTKAAPIRTSLVNGMISQKRLPKGKNRLAKADTNSSKKKTSSSFWNSASEKLTRVTGWLKPHSEDRNRSSNPKLASVAINPVSGLSYPPANNSTRIGLAQSWRNNTKNLLSFGDSIDHPRAQGVQLDEACCVTSQDGAYDPSISGGNPVLVLSRLNVAIVHHAVKRGPMLAHRPPSVGDHLAGLGLISQIDNFAACQVLTKSKDGLFWALCPSSPKQVPGPLYNANSELTGVIVGTSPSYCGHNCFLVADSSLINALINDEKEILDSSVYDINYALDNHIMNALKKHPAGPLRSNGAALNTTARPGKALGNIKLGATVEQVVQFLGEGERTASNVLGHGLNNSDPMFSYLKYDQYGVGLNFYDNRLVAIETIEPQYHTPFGLGVGLDFNTSNFTHEMRRRVCRGYTEHGTALIAVPGLEVELNGNGVIALLRITI